MACEFVPVRSLLQPEEIEGYLALWGSPEVRDCYGTYFSKEQPPEMDLNYLPIPLRYGHGQDEQIGTGPIGSVVKIWLDDKGIKFRALLDKARTHYDRIAQEITRGILGVSTGAPEYLAQFAEDGRFVSWPITADVSLTDKPCEFRMPSVAAVRSMPDAHYELQCITPAEAVTGDGPRDCGCDDGNAVRSPEKPEVNKRNNPMPTKKPAKRAGLTLGALGLTPESTVQDLYQAMVDSLGEGATNALFEGLGGPAVEADEPEMPDQMSVPEDQDPMREDYTDPEKDSRPEQFQNNTDLEDVSQGKPGGSARGSDLTQVLARLLANQVKAQAPRSKPQAQKPSVMAELQKQNRMLMQLLAQAPVTDQPTQPQDRRSAPVKPFSHRVEMVDLKYDMGSAADLAFAVRTLEAVGKRPSDALLKATSYKIADEIERGTAVGSDLTVRWTTPFRSRNDVMAMDVKAFRSNEVMGDSNTGYGSNYVGVFYDTTLWLKTRAMPVWKELMARGMEEKVIPVGYSSDVIPLEGADFSWYRVPETVDVDATGRPKINITPSKIGTNSTTLTVRTLGALVYYSVLLEEDSIVPMAAELNRKAGIEFQEQVEYVIFNGDTATGTGNLNYKNGTVNAADVYNFTVADGLLKAAIIGNSGNNARSASGLSDLDYQLLFAKLGNNGIVAADPNKLLYFVDPSTGLATDRLPIVKTRDINGAATVENGKAKEMYGVPILRSGQIALADTTGYIDSVTPGNNAKGRILLVRPDQWVCGFKRQVTMEYFRDVPGQSNGMVITVRFGMQYRDATQAGAASYNVTV